MTESERELAVYKECEQKNLAAMAELRADRLVLLDSLEWAIIAFAQVKHRPEDLQAISDASWHVKRIRAKP